MEKNDNVVKSTIDELMEKMEQGFAAAKELAEKLKTMKELCDKAKPIILTPFEHEILLMAKKAGYTYIARSKELGRSLVEIARSAQGLEIYSEKPPKGNTSWLIAGDAIQRRIHFQFLNWLDCFHFIKWEDEEPYSIEELLKCEVQS